MKIRKYQHADAAAVARVHRNAVKHIVSKDYSKRQIAAWLKRISAQRVRESPKKEIRFVAVENGKIVGFGSHEGHELTAVYIHQDYIGKGVGKKLLKKVEQSAYKQGFRKLICFSTIAGKDFYEKQGFKLIRRRKHRIGNQKLRVFMMGKRLRKNH